MPLTLCVLQTLYNAYSLSPLPAQSAVLLMSVTYSCKCYITNHPPCWWLKEQLFILTRASGLSGPGLIQLALISVYRLDRDLLSMLVVILIQSQGWPWHFLLMAERWEGLARLYQQLSSLCFCHVCYYPTEQSRSRGQTQHQWSRWRYGGPGFGGRNEYMMNNHPVYHMPKSKCTGSVSMPSAGSQDLAWASALGRLPKRTRAPLTHWEQFTSKRYHLTSWSATGWSCLKPSRLAQWGTLVSRTNAVSSLKKSYLLSLI